LTDCVTDSVPCDIRLHSHSLFGGVTQLAKMEWKTDEEAKEIEAAEWSKVDRDRAKLLLKEVQFIRETVTEMAKLQSDAVVVLRELSAQLKTTNRNLTAILSANEKDDAGGVH